MRRTASLVLWVWVAAWPNVEAGAESATAVSVDLALENERVVAQLRVDGAFTPSFRRRLSGGLESRVEIETRLTDREGAVVGRGRRSCKILYSLWDEQVYVSVEDEGRGGPIVSTFAEVPPALEACGKLQAFPVALAGALALSGGYRLEARVVLNPVSEELVERSRQFITNPRGGAQGGSNAVLGAVAGLFSRRGGALGETFDFISPPLERPSRSSSFARGTRTPTRAQSSQTETSP